jgi:hypothetical protein
MGQKTVDGEEERRMRHLYGRIFTRQSSYANPLWMWFKSDLLSLALSPSMEWNSRKTAPLVGNELRGRNFENQHSQIPQNRERLGA